MLERSRARTLKPSTARALKRLNALALERLENNLGMRFRAATTNTDIYARFRTSSGDFGRFRTSGLWAGKNTADPY